MSNQTEQQRRLLAVLNRLIVMADDDADFAESFSEDLNQVLDDIHGQDGFGTEGQCDPRGDFREGKWSMQRVEGVDTK
jgi:hypothetical protein